MGDVLAGLCGGRGAACGAAARAGPCWPAAALEHASRLGVLPKSLARGAATPQGDAQPVGRTCCGGLVEVSNLIIQSVNPEVHCKPLIAEPKREASDKYLFVLFCT